MNDGFQKQMLYLRKAVLEVGEFINPLRPFEVIGYTLAHLGYF
jgi:hypothetical protein